MSWTLRGLELWSAGLRKEKQVITGITYPKAAEHAWRIAFLMRELRERRTDIEIAPAKERGGDFAAQQLEKIILPNGSVISILNQMGGKFQGSGYGVVTMEEASQYRFLKYMYSQAQIVTQGKPGTRGGFVVLVANAWPNPEWKDTKKAVNELGGE